MLVGQRLHPVADDLPLGLGAGVAVADADVPGCVRADPDAVVERPAVEVGEGVAVSHVLDVAPESGDRRLGLLGVGELQHVRVLVVGHAGAQPVVHVRLVDRASVVVVDQVRVVAADAAERVAAAGARAQGGLDEPPPQLVSDLLEEGAAGVGCSLSVSGRRELAQLRGLGSQVVDVEAGRRRRLQAARAPAPGRFGDAADGLPLDCWSRDYVAGPTRASVAVNGLSRDSTSRGEAREPFGEVVPAGHDRQSRRADRRQLLVSHPADSLTA